MDMSNNWWVLTISFDAMTKVMVALCATWYMYWAFRRR